MLTVVFGANIEIKFYLIRSVSFFVVLIRSVSFFVVFFSPFNLRLTYAFCLDLFLVIHFPPLFSPCDDVTNFDSAWSRIQVRRLLSMVSFSDMFFSASWLTYRAISRGALSFDMVEDFVPS